MFQPPAGLVDAEVLDLVRSGWLPAVDRVEHLALAPRERDLSTLVQAGYGDRLQADVAMVELFDLEWRLSEIDSYAAWFACPHTGTTDDRVAYEGLRSELHRDRWWQA